MKWKHFSFNSFILIVAVSLCGVNKSKHIINIASSFHNIRNIYYEMAVFMIRSRPSPTELSVFRDEKNSHHSINVEEENTPSHSNQSKYHKLINEENHM